MLFWHVAQYSCRRNSTFSSKDLQQGWLLLLVFPVNEPYFPFCKLLWWIISHTSENMEQKIKPVMYSTLTFNFRLQGVKCYVYQYMCIYIYTHIFLHIYRCECKATQFLLPWFLSAPQTLGAEATLCPVTGLRKGFRDSVVSDQVCSSSFSPPYV